MTDNLELQNAKIKFKVHRGADQTFTVNVKGDTMREIITKVEYFAQNAKDEIENIGALQVKSVEIALGENSFFDFKAIFR